MLPKGSPETDNERVEKFGVSVKRREKEREEKRREREEKRREEKRREEKRREEKEREKRREREEKKRKRGEEKRTICEGIRQSCTSKLREREFCERSRMRTSENEENVARSNFGE